VFGPRIAATTDAGADYRGAPTLAEEGFPQLLLLDTGLGHKPRTTNEWHTDVTFTPNPPIGSLFAMEIPAESGGDTLWSDQHLAYDGLSEPVRRLIGGLSAVHGRPPTTGTSVHPMVGHHTVTGRPYLYVNRGWTRSVQGLHDQESRHLLEMLFERAERPELQVRWRWSAGDAALWDNRCTMHYAVADYGTERRRARRATIYAE
jgi:taurine dioxygenase